MSTRRLIAAYGSLREGHYNFDRFESSFPDLKVHKRNHKIEGFQMYGLGSYPGIIKGPGEIEVDILECSRECFAVITHMELKAGFSAIELFIDNEQVIIYPYEGKVFPQFKVQSGNWNIHTNKLKQNGNQSSNLQ